MCSISKSFKSLDGRELQRLLVGVEFATCFSGLYAVYCWVVVAFMSVVCLPGGVKIAICFSEVAFALLENFAISQLLPYTSHDVALYLLQNDFHREIFHTVCYGGGRYDIGSNLCRLAEFQGKCSLQNIATAKISPPTSCNKNDRLPLFGNEHE